MTIYEICDRMLECIDPETGEINEERLNALEMARDEKLESVACWYKDLVAESAAIQGEMKKLRERSQRAQNKADSLKKYLAYWLAGEKFKTPKVAISYRKSKSVAIAEGANVPESYRRVKWEPDKTALKEALEAGEKFDGITLEENESMIIK